MSRKDIWSQADDITLAETILKHVRSGSTQLKAFDEVAEKLGRTPNACGFRWNSVVRKQYETQLKEAKQQRKEPKDKDNKQSKVSVINDPFANLAVAVEQITQAYNQLLKDYNKLQRQFAKLQKKIEQRLHTEDLDTLLQIINNVKEMGLLNKESSA